MEKFSSIFTQRPFYQSENKASALKTSKKIGSRWETHWIQWISIYSPSQLIFLLLEVIPCCQFFSWLSHSFQDFWFSHSCRNYNKHPCSARAECGIRQTKMLWYTEWTRKCKDKVSLVFGQGYWNECWHAGLDSKILWFWFDQHQKSDFEFHII